MIEISCSSVLFELSCLNSGVEKHTINISLYKKSLNIPEAVNQRTENAMATIKRIIR